MVSSISQTTLLSVSQAPLSSIKIQEVLSTLIIFGSTPTVTNSIFTALSLGPSWTQFMVITPFEAIYVGLIIIQVAALNLVGIMPIKVNMVFQGLQPGRKKRGVNIISQEKRLIVIQLLTLAKKLDLDECFFKTICQLVSHSDKNRQITSIIRSMINSMRQSSSINKEEDEFSFNVTDNQFKTHNTNIGSSEDLILQLYEDALKNSGSKINEDIASNLSRTACQRRYSLCPLDRNEIMAYVETIDDLSN